MTIEKPNIEISLSRTTSVISNEPQVVLFVGQMTSAGTATAGALIESIANDNSQDTLFGEDSMLAGMIRNAKKYNQVTQFDAIPLDDDGSAVPSTGTFNFSGTATEAGTLYITVGSGDDHRYEVAVDDEETDEFIAFKVVALIDLDDKCPMHATSTVPGIVTLIAVNGGEEGNTIGLRAEGSVAGITVATTAMASGATNPTLTDIFDVVGDKRYQTIVWPSTYITSELTTFLTTRFNEAGKPLDGVGVLTKVNTVIDAVVYLNTLDTQVLCIGNNKKVDVVNYRGASVQEIGYALSSQFAAIRSLRLTKDANIANYVVSPTGALDDFGGAAISSLPYFNTPFSRLPVVDVGNEFTKTEQDQILAAGGFVWGNNPSRTGIILGEVVTTYKTDAASNPDDTFKYLNYVDTAVACREFFYNNLRSTYAQSRLTEGALIVGRSMANVESIGAELDGLYAILSERDYVLTEAGRAAIRFFRNNRTIELFMEEGKVEVTMILQIVTQLRTMLISMKIGFPVNG